MFSTAKRPCITVQPGPVVATSSENIMYAYESPIQWTDNRLRTLLIGSIIVVFALGCIGSSIGIAIAKRNPPLPVAPIAAPGAMTPLTPIIVPIVEVPHIAPIIPIVSPVLAPVIAPVVAPVIAPAVVPVAVPTV